MKGYPKEAYNILHILYEKKEDDDLFNFDDEEINNLNHQLNNVEVEISYFIEKRIHPGSREKLEKLLKKQMELLQSYFYRENKLIYENGVIDGLNIIFSNFSLEKKNNKKKNCSI